MATCISFPNCWISECHIWPTFHILFYILTCCYFLGEASGLEDKEKRRLLAHPEEKLSEISRLEKQVEDLQKARELLTEGVSHERKQLQVRTMWKENTEPGGGAPCPVISTVIVLRRTSFSEGQAERNRHHLLQYYVWGFASSGEISHPLTKFPISWFCSSVN